MRRIIFILTFFCALAVSAQNYVIYNVKGTVKLVTKKGSRDVKKGHTLAASDVINVAAKSRLDLIDEKGMKKISITTPGQNTVAKMMSSKKNTISEVSFQYLSYLKNMLTDKVNTDTSDPATITMHGAKKDSTAQADVEKPVDANQTQNVVPVSTNSGGNLSGFVQSISQEYEDFRGNAWKEYVNFVRQAWNEYGSQPAEPAPRFKEIPPVEYVKTTPMPAEPNVVEVQEEIVDMGETYVQPMPIAKIGEVRGNDEGKVRFMLFGTPCEARISNNVKFTLADTSEKSIADALAMLGGKESDNTIRDCLELRYDLRLSDWAYLLMLRQLAEAVFGEGTNESVLFNAYLYLQSGYKMRLASDGQKVYMLFSSMHNIYEKSYYVLDGERYYSLSDMPEKLVVCNVKFPQEKSLSLFIPKIQGFEEKKTDVREVRSRKYPELSMSLYSNKNLMDFYSTYPTSNLDNNLMSRWVMYADAPMNTSICEQVYKDLKSKLAGDDRLLAVSKLLDLVQTGFEYKYDEEVWGRDRVFFAEETLFYPYCDCEDRSILFTRLVRDVLGLDCVLLYYPGHLASAVYIPGCTSGQCVEVNGKQYMITDPTYIGAGPGVEMPNMEDRPVVIKIGK